MDRRVSKILKILLLQNCPWYEPSLEKDPYFSVFTDRVPAMFYGFPKTTTATGVAQDRSKTDLPVFESQDQK